MVFDFPADMSFSTRWATSRKIQDSVMCAGPIAESLRSQCTDRTGTGGTNKSASAGGGDHVEFSSTLGRLSGLLSGSQTDRTARVQELAVQYQNGTYRT